VSESGGFGEIQGCRNVHQGQLGISQHVASEGRAHLVGNRSETCPFRPQSTVKGPPMCGQPPGHRCGRTLLFQKLFAELPAEFVPFIVRTDPFSFFDVLLQLLMHDRVRTRKWLLQRFGWEDQRGHFLIEVHLGSKGRAVGFRVPGCPSRHENRGSYPCAPAQFANYLRHRGQRSLANQARALSHRTIWAVAEDGETVRDLQLDDAATGPNSQMSFQSTKSVT
jgi:hypothetical protein